MVEAGQKALPSFQLHLQEGADETAAQAPGNIFHPKNLQGMMKDDYADQRKSVFDGGQSTYQQECMITNNKVTIKRTRNQQNMDEGARAWH